MLLQRVVAFYRAHGVRDHSLRTVAGAIGTSQRMLHYHFGSRDQVVLAAANAVMDDVLWDGEGADREPTPAAKLAAPARVGEWRAWLEAVWETGCRRAIDDGALLVELTSHAIRGLPSGAGLGGLQAQLQAGIRRRLDGHPAAVAAGCADLIAASMVGLWLDLAAGRSRARVDRAFGMLLDGVEQTLGAGGVDSRRLVEAGD